MSLKFLIHFKIQNQAVLTFEGMVPNNAVSQYKNNPGMVIVHITHKMKNLLLFLPTNESFKTCSERTINTYFDLTMVPAEFYVWKGGNDIK